MLRFFPTISVALLLAPAMAVCAESLPLWEVGAGAAVMRLPDYRGSTTYRNYLLPLPYVIWRGDVFRIDRRGATGVLFESKRLELDVSASATNPARSSDNPVREGMPDLHPTLELGPQLRYILAESPDRSRKVTFELPVRAVLALEFPRVRSIGWIANPLLNADWRHVGGTQWNVSVQGGPLWGDRRYHDYYYSVTDQYARADRPRYQAAGGYSGTQFTLAVSRRYEHLWVGGFVRGYQLQGATFAGSPLVRSTHAVMAGVAFAWVFARSDQRVQAEE